MSCQSNKSQTHTYWLSMDLRHTQRRDLSNMMYKIKHLFCLTFVFTLKCNITLNHFAVTLHFPLNSALLFFHHYSISFRLNFQRWPNKAVYSLRPAISTIGGEGSMLVWENLSLSQQAYLGTHDPRDQRDFLVPPKPSSTTPYVCWTLLLPELHLDDLQVPAF